MPIQENIGAVLRLDVNTKGRDFIAGDIHGCFSQVYSALFELGFNRSTDRLICAGDMIDRGPDSHKVLEFLSQPYVYGLRGNHEQLLVESPIETIIELAQQNYDGLGWVAHIPRRMLFQIKQAMAKLPLAIEVPTRTELIGVVHADVPDQMTWQEMVSLLEAEDEFTTEYVIGSRHRVETNLLRGVEGVSKVFIGHTIVEEPVRLGNVIALDTGAYKREFGNQSYRMTVLNAATPLALIRQQEQQPMPPVSARHWPAGAAEERSTSVL
jgi:serine/threonine protein phosphatase 1